MTIEIKVGPPVITINQGSTFMVTDQRGEIDPRMSRVPPLLRCRPPRN